MSFTDTSILNCRNLSYRVRDAELLHSIDLDVRCGETLGIVGPNGSGKPPHSAFQCAGCSFC